MEFENGSIKWIGTAMTPRSSGILSGKEDDHIWTYENPLQG